ncbi:potassium channel family protein [Natrarchaeobius oligotrophus]|uniref:Potassium transporter TrkA n=1 Tax=Natrarchaeobius chitinivorans TaxID=1679083 RepID=A0A3N6M491_NATCH|nr:TrkA C-terminal domain-containing protein [Natrarchaeobius chitinivorans]RQG95294.1 potassium transporter TrkA [Natrarchaeobius chitinivorans]
MTSLLISEILVGVYLGLIAALFPSFITFSIGFGFKYFTNVTVPGLGVVALGGTLAGVTGGLMGLMDPQLAGSWTGIIAILVILMSCLWAHSQGDKLGEATPRRLTLKSLRENQLSAELAERVDSYGQIRIRPAGEIYAIEGYPPLPEALREQLHSGSWKFPANLSLSELETRLEERLTTDYELAEVDVIVDKRGRAEIAAAPSAAGLSRRIPPGRCAVSIQTLLPTGVARGDSVTIKLPDGDVTGPVVSARTNGIDTPKEPDPASTESEDGEADEKAKKPPAMTTTGGEGQVTVALLLTEARRVVRTDFAPMIVHSRGKQREYEAIGILKQDGNQFRNVTIGNGSTLSGTTIGTARIRDTHGVGILTIQRATEQLIAPSGMTELLAGDTLIVVGRPDQLRAFEEVAT